LLSSSQEVRKTLNLLSYSANATAQIVAKQTMKQRDQLVEKSALSAAPKNAAQTHFGCIGPQSLREMDQFIMRNPANPALSNANPGAWVSPPKDALVTKKKTLLKTPEYDVNSIILKTSFANGMRPGQHLYVAPRVLKLGTLEDGYRRYSIGGINRAEDSVKLIYRQIKTGRVSENVLSKARVGDTLKVQGPDWNGFVLPPRSSNMLAFAVGIANIAPMHCLLKTRLKLQEGPLGQTKLFSTYHSPEHEVPYGSQKLALVGGCLTPLRREPPQPGTRRDASRASLRSCPSHYDRVSRVRAKVGLRPVSSLLERG